MAIKNHKCKIICLVIVLVGFFVVGKLLDLEAERVIQQLYARDNQGIIQGQQDIIWEQENNNQEALILIHGFGSSPEVYKETIQAIKNSVNMDIYAPLLPFHGRNLEAASKMQMKEMEAYLEKYIKKQAEKYKKIHVVGHSMGGLLLSNLASQEVLPDNSQLILYAPAIFIKNNTWIYIAGIRIYTLWRYYSNYALLGTDFSSYESVDRVAKTRLEKDRNLRYMPIDAVARMYRLDLNSRKYIDQWTRPYVLIGAMDDNRIDIAKLKTSCELNKKYCTFYGFETGRHFLHWGTNKKAFEALIINLVQQQSEQVRENH